jgi:1-acyl-sn-glycerol-3-phosphate acyltransferase/nucleoside-diphosphate-sugar epimerase
MTTNTFTAENPAQCQPAVGRVVLIEPRARLAALLADRLNSRWDVEAMVLAPVAGRREIVAELTVVSPDVVVYSPLNVQARDFTPDLHAAEDILGACAESAVRKVVLLSSACAYTPDYHNPGLIPESRQLPVRRPNRVAEAWRSVEAMARRLWGFDARTRLVILRPALSVVPEAPDWASRLFRRRWAFTVAGFNPSIQVVGESELAEAVCCAVVGEATGIFNIAPDGVVPLRRALRAAGVVGISVPWSAERLGRALFHRLGWSCSSDQQEYLRYSWTISNERSKRELGMSCGRSTVDARSCAPRRHITSAPEPAVPERFDDFGMDEDFIRVRSRKALGFMARRYWRIEARGLEHLPRQSRAVLVGIHRGFMPFDGVMMVHLLEKHIGRIPRFLMHPGLVKFPYIAPFLTNLGGIIACQENAEYVLERDEILGVFPEGIRGAFRMYRDAYTLDRFGRSDFVKIALRHRAPIVPFVFLGTAETFPILSRIDSAWWKRYTEWPFIPITPTFPFLLPIPLPAKWHLQVLPPLPVHEMYSPADAGNARVVGRIGDEVRDRMQRVLDAMRERRRSIFLGSIFDEEIMPELTGTSALQEFPATASRNLETTVS